MSKNNIIVSNIHRDAAFIETKPLLNNTVSGNNQPYGSLTISQKALGVNYPNVQSAVDDIFALQPLPINTVITNTDGISPNPVCQVDNYTITGSVIVPGKTVGQPTNLIVYGYSVEVLVGDTAAQVTDKVKVILNGAQAKGEIFSRITPDPGRPTVLEITYLDNQDHVLPTYTMSGITFTQTIISPAKQGYGAWTYLGSLDHTLVGYAENPLKLYYYKRVA